MAADRAERRRDLVAQGYDPARLKARIDAARAAAYAKPAEAAKPVAKVEAAKVVDLSAARAKKAAATTRWGPSWPRPPLPSSSAGRGTVRGDADAADHRDLRDGGSPPSPWELAAPSRRRALRACALGYDGECQDLLDEAQKIDPEGENNAQVQGARSLRAPIRSLTTSKRRWAPGKGRSSAILDAHDRYLSAEERGHATEERTMQAYGRVGATDDRAHPARHRGLTRPLGPNVPGMQVTVALVRRTMGAIRPDGTGMVGGADSMSSGIDAFPLASCRRGR